MHDQETEDGDKAYVYLLTIDFCDGITAKNQVYKVGFSEFSRSRFESLIGIPFIKQITVITLLQVKITGRGAAKDAALKIEADICDMVFHKRAFGREWFYLSSADTFKINELLYSLTIESPAEYSITHPNKIIRRTYGYREIKPKIKSQQGTVSHLEWLRVKRRYNAIKG